MEPTALPLIFQRFRKLGRNPESIADELLGAVKTCNWVPPQEEKRYREAIAREYASFCKEVAR